MNYKKTIQTTAGPDDVRGALTTGYHNWWTTPDRPILKVGDIAKFGFSDLFGYWSFKALELSDRRVVLECVDALHIQEGYPKAIETEWLGSQLIWTIEPDENGTRVTLEHDGLTPDLHCFDICRMGWDLFFVDSLKSYLDTGFGKPFSLQRQP